MSSTSKTNRSVEMVTHDGDEAHKHHDNDGAPPLQQEDQEEARDTGDEPYAEITRAVQNQLRRNKETLLKEVKERSDKQIETAVKRALDERDVQQSSSKKAKKERDFKREANKIRYRVNEDIIEKIEEGIKAIDREDLSAAKTAMEEGKKILTKQQKLICLADREDNGWTVVKHYLSDDLASDTDDEKAISKARREAMATIKKKQTKRKESVKFRNASQRNGPYKRDYHYRRDYEKREYDFKPRYETQSSDRRAIVCYRCGKPGHYQRVCPLKFERR